MKTKKENRIELSSKETSELFIEGLITIILLILINLASYILLIQIIDTSIPLDRFLIDTKSSIYDIFYKPRPTFFLWQKPLIISFILIDLGILYWRLNRRYKQMQQQHIITELHYISNGHYDHRIPFELKGDLGRLVSSINALVDSTVHAIEEERLIEQSKDELITNVSHDIRTPLTSIIGYLGLIEEQKYENEEELLKYTQIAYSKSKQMKVLVEDLFEYTKVRQSNAPLTQITFDMNQLLAQLAIDYELEAYKKQKEILFEPSKNLLMMTGDPEKLVRVFENLLSNALKYGINGSKIIITSESTDTHAIIKVKNDGETIPDNAIEHLFDRFYRVERSRSQQTGGSGLGLAIAQSIVELHHGVISASSIDRWTTFSVELPLHHTKQD